MRAASHGDSSTKRSGATTGAPNSERDSLRHLILIEAKVPGKESSEPFSGELKIPVLFNGQRMAVRVPYYGHYSAPALARPDRLVVLSSIAKGQMEADVLIERQDRGSFPAAENVNCQCPDKRVKLTFVKPSDSVTMGLIGTVHAQVDLSEGKSFDTQITIRARLGSYKLHLNVPVTVRVVP